MNCIYICLLNEKQYIDMFQLLLESIFIYGNLDNNIDIVINTSNDCMNIIKEHILFNNEKIKVEINDNKLDIFNLSSIKKYYIQKYLLQLKMI